MPDLPPFSTNPADIIAWVDSLTPEQQRELQDQILNDPLLSALASPVAFAGRVNPVIELPPAPAAPSTYTIRVDIVGAKPPIWRRLAVRSDVTLDVLHQLLQAAFGWWDDHLHRFSLGAPYGSPYFVTPEDLREGEEGTYEHVARLDQVLTEPGARLTYEYDFGDGWTHRLVLESVDPWPKEETRTAWCLAGRRAGPVEDSGGIWSYEGLAAWARSGYADDQAPDDDPETLREWLPEDFDPDRFSVEEVDAALEEALAGDAGLVARDLGLREGAVIFAASLSGEPARTVADWLAAAMPEQAARSVDPDLAAAATRPWRVLLRHVGEGVTLTKAGYLPPAVVEGLIAELGLDEIWIGKGNREDLTQPVLRLREQAQQLGLLRKAKGRLTPTAAARRAAGDPVALLRHIAGRLPLGQHEDEHLAGWAALVATAAGQERKATDEAIAEILTSLGWTVVGGDRVPREAAAASAGPTRAVLNTASGELGFVRRDRPHRHSVLLARMALLGR